MIEWYAAACFPGEEFSVKRRLVRLGIESYVPIAHKRKKSVSVPVAMLHGYLFVKASTEDIAVLKSVQDFSHLLRAPGSEFPTPVGQESIRAVMACEQYLAMSASAGLSVQPGDFVELIGTALKGHKGKVMSVQNKRITVLLQTLGSIGSVIVPVSDLERLHEPITNHGSEPSNVRGGFSTDS